MHARDGGVRAERMLHHLQMIVVDGFVQRGRRAHVALLHFFDVVVQLPVGAHGVALGIPLRQDGAELVLRNQCAHLLQHCRWVTGEIAKRVHVIQTLPRPHDRRCAVCLRAM